MKSQYAQYNTKSLLTVAAQLIGFVIMINPIIVDAKDANWDFQLGNDGRLRDFQLGNDGRLKLIKEITVIDTNRKQVGEIAGPSSAGICGGSPVLYQFENHIFFVGVSEAGFVKCDSDIYSFFESTNCSGTPFVTVHRGALIQGARIGEPGSTVYLPNLNDIREHFQSHSTFAGYMRECITVDNIIENAAPEIPIINLDDIFTPPFKVRTE